MNIPLAQAKNGIIYAGYNQNQSCLAVGSKAGFMIFRTFPFGKCFGGMHEGSIKIVEMLGCSSLVAVVGIGDQPEFSPRKLHLWNTKSCTSICDLTFHTPIMGVKMNQQRLVVILENKIHVYNLERVEVIFSVDILEDAIPPVPMGAGAAGGGQLPVLGLAALCPTNNFLAYPCSAVEGTVLVVDTSLPPNPAPQAAAGAAAGAAAAPQQPHPSRKHLIHAHENAVVALCFNQQGNYLATASTKGTVVRVWTVPDGVKKAEFRRSNHKSAHIYNLCFSQDSSLLACTCDTGTVHVFAMDGRHAGSKAFAYCRLKTPQPCIASFTPDNQFVNVTVAEGTFQRYRLPAASSGKKDCELDEFYSLTETTNEVVAAP